MDCGMSRTTFMFATLPGIGLQVKLPQLDGFAVDWVGILAIILQYHHHHHHRHHHPKHRSNHANHPCSIMQEIERERARERNNGEQVKYDE